jgi:hypothetical protein
MKPLQYVSVIVGILLLGSPALHAQYTPDDYLNWTRQHLDNGDCEKARATYELYKDKVPAGKADVERRIAECGKYTQNPSTSVSSIAKGVSNDMMNMNIHGNVSGFVEKSYYTVEDDNLHEEPVDGGLFDDATFLSCVYSDEHVARVFFKKWFLCQVSDCEIHFDKNGNVIFIKSIWKDGGQVYFSYDENQRVKEMDARNKARNQDEGVVKYEYVLEDNQVKTETLLVENDYGNDTCTISYSYDAKQNLMRAIMKMHGRDFFFNYSDNRISSIFLDNYWRDDGDVSFEIEYNGKGDIQRVSATGKIGRRDFATTTTFEYEYDSHNNWIKRIGEGVFKDGTKVTIKTERTYTYY